jgi:hypothetical protein
VPAPWGSLWLLVVLDDGLNGSVEADQQRNIAGYDLGKHPHGRAYLLLASLVSHQASQDFVSYALLVFREHAVRPTMSEPRQTMLEIVLIAWWSASALYACHSSVLSVSDSLARWILRPFRC